MEVTAAFLLLLVLCDASGDDAGHECIGHDSHHDTVLHQGYDISCREEDRIRDADDEAEQENEYDYGRMPG